MSKKELHQVITQLQDLSWGNTLTEMRMNFTNGFSMPTHPTAEVQPVDIAGVMAEWITCPNSNTDRVILYLHGGGFIMGSLPAYRRLASDLAEVAGASVLLLDYRLAPEHPYPAGLEDAFTAYHWLVNTRGCQPSQIAIAGDSAGGNLALGLLLSLKDREEPQPACIALISPYCDQMRTGSTMVSHADRDLMVTAPLLDTITDWYAPGEDLRSPLISPLYADLSDLPPLLIHVGANEVLLDDALRLARQVGLADVPVTLKVWADMIHCFHLFAPVLEEGQVAISEVGAFLNRSLSTLTNTVSHAAIGTP